MFATGTIHLDIDDQKPAAWLCTPGAGNANLVAQRGRVFLQKAGREDLWDWSKAEHTPNPLANLQTARIDTRLVRIDLPVECVDDAMFFLGRRGISASALFPGETGIAREAEDDARFPILGARKRGEKLATPLDWNGERTPE